MKRLLSRFNILNRRVGLMRFLPKFYNFSSTMANLSPQEVFIEQNPNIEETQEIEQIEQRGEVPLENEDIHLKSSVLITTIPLVYKFNCEKRQIRYMNIGIIELMSLRINSIFINFSHYDLVHVYLVFLTTQPQMDKIRLVIFIRSVCQVINMMKYQDYSERFLFISNYNENSFFNNKASSHYSSEYMNQSYSDKIIKALENSEILLCFPEQFILNYKLLNNYFDKKTEFLFLNCKIESLTYFCQKYSVLGLNERKNRILIMDSEGTSSSINFNFHLKKNLEQGKHVNYSWFENFGVSFLSIFSYD